MSCTAHPSLAIARRDPAFGGDRKIRRPAWVARQQLNELLDVALSDRHLADDLVVNVHRDGVAGGVDSDQGFGQDVACDALRDVLSPEPAISAGATPAFH